MNLQQLRYFNEIVRRDLNISAAAASLFTSQPAISKQIKLLEEELGIQIFLRNGKRITALTEPGKGLLAIARRMLLDAENFKQFADEFHSKDSGHLTLATTHTQARYALPPVVKQFIERYPKVKLGLHQGNPTQIAQQVLNGEADICIATESLTLYDGLVTLPCYEWHHCVITPPDHPLLQEPELTLDAIARYPIITYDHAFSGRSKINDAFEKAGIVPDIALTAIDADVIKTYVELGLGIGILAEIAFIPDREPHLRRMNARHLFKPSTTRIAIRKNEYLRGYTYDFIALFAPHLTAEVVNRAMHLANLPEQD
ncbi:MAG: transcriptional regulator CysB [Gallionellaceae bacterium CG1_02_56_997]|nr:CysB family HTH-type transcriptional regulator [Gallionella sp.]OIO75823.1 MAG: transcriptional regulator CysB [Gallionellaceae bacterium CG1_02_56_997]PIV15270.1 MAG: transcriptional regulator CysB [Gallionellales bacterium CG03_land_8_20_14_0_80_55_15]PIX03969.1 MAG: transcriptional regulator CysB [Gallionellales bacterium CG_4_8_14_3_um_filter_54_18]PJC05548.1 MAG: transcriptional regulator CysB [Gallionellales bacterium CG_4_9_14_0_8_um_filter_55_61]